MRRQQHEYFLNMQTDERDARSDISVPSPEQRSDDERIRSSKASSRPEHCSSTARILLSTFFEA